MSVMSDFIEGRIVKDNNGCWLWQLAITRHGYGHAYHPVTKKNARPHRLAYIEYVGPVPEGLVLDHKCRVRHCVNPEHLEPVTSQINALRGIGPTAINAKKTHCIRGHELSGNNLRIYNGRRQCHTCIKMRRRRYINNKRRKLNVPH